MSVLVVILTAAALLLTHTEPQSSPAGNGATEATSAGVADPSPSPSSLSLTSLLADLMPSREHLQMVWDAREVSMAECLAAVGFTWIPRPHDDSVDDWARWYEWYNSVTARHPDLEALAFGRSEQSGPATEGCQLESYRAVHRDGMTVEARAADLYNDAAAYVAGLSAEGQTLSDEAIAAGLTVWAGKNKDLLDELRSDAAAEYLRASEILDHA